MFHWLVVVLAFGAVQAAIASAGTFAAGAALPLLMVLLLPGNVLMGGLAVSSLGFLALLGLLAARAGGAPCWHPYCGSRSGARWRWA